jgi:hypothetical protein
VDGRKSDRWQNVPILLLAGTFLSVLLMLFTAPACAAVEGRLAIYCGNAKAHSYAWHGLPALTALVGAALGVALGGRSRLVWPLSALLLVAATAALVLTRFLAEPPPGFGPGW